MDENVHYFHIVMIGKEYNKQYTELMIDIVVILAYSAALRTQNCY